MSKKDIVFVALLMNAAVLSLLIAFATNGATTPHHEIVSSASSEIQALPQPQTIVTSHDVKKKNISSLDEIDALLEEYLPSEAGGNEKSKKEAVSKTEPRSTQKVAKPASSLPFQVKKTEAQKEGTKMYTIQPGDNPWKIAKKFHLSFEKLLELNHLNEATAKNLKVGQKLRIQE